MADIVLRIEGQDFSGWTETSITMDVRTIAWSFSAAVTLPVEGVIGPVIRKQQAFELLYNGIIVMTGYIDEVSTSYGSDNVSIDITGRSLTGQLVDSAAVYEGGQFNDLSLPDIAKALCTPFGIEVVTPNATTDKGLLDAIELEYTTFQTVRIEQGETVFDLLERLARQRGFLLTTNNVGSLVITRASEQLVTPTLRTGDNIKNAQGTDSLESRASHYIVKGSTNGGLEFNPNQSSGNAVEVNDPDITLYRPRIIVCETELTNDTATQRGQWQRCRDLGDGTQENYTLTGWTNDTELWQPNTLVTVDDTIIGIDAVRMIVAVTLTEGDSGELATLTTQPPESLVITKESAKEESQSWATL